MPTMINGIGTNYVGKKNLSAHEAVCQQCGQPATLSSYDTRLCFVVLFIPIVPLGKKRVIDACSRCSQHRVMPLDEYRKLQTETLDKLAEAHLKDPNDAQVAIELNSAFLEFGRTEEAAKHLEQVRGRFSDNVDFLLYANAAFHQLGRAEEAGQCVDRAYQLAPQNPGARHAKTLARVNAGDLQEAYHLLKETPAEERDPGLLFLLADAYRESGDALTALEVYRLLLEDHPELAHDKQVKKAVRAAEKDANRSSGLLPPKIVPWGKIAAAAAVLALVVIVPMAINAYLEGHATLHVVNGYPGVVTLVIDGTHHVSFEEPGRRELKLAEGTHRAEVVEPWQETIDFTLKRTLGERFGDGPVAVLNPGGLAVLMWQETIYSAQEVSDYEMQVKLHGGKSFQVFKNVDYPFREFPDEIELSSKRERVRKNRLTEMFADPEQAYVWFLSTDNAAGALAYLERWLAVEPRDALALGYSGVARASGEAERAAELLRPHLAVAPVNIEWHRAYQQVAEADESRQQQLLEEYEGYLAEDPESAALLYLRGRIEPDPEQAQSFYQRALARQPDHRYASRGSAYGLLSQGRFREAADLLAAATARHGDDTDLVELYRGALSAAGRFDELERMLRPNLELEVAEVDWGQAIELIHLLVRRGAPEEAEALIRELGERDRALPEDQRSQVEPWLQVNLFYATANWTALEKALGRREPHFWKDTVSFWLAVETGEVDGLNPAELGGFEKLLISLVFARQDLPERLEVRRQEALDELVHLDASYRVYRDLSSGALALTPEAVERMVTEPQQKAVLLTSLAVQYPEHRAWLLRKAQHLSYSLGFPHHLLASFQE